MIQKGKKAQAWRAVMKHGVGTKSLETRVVGKPITSSWVAEFMLEMPILYDVLLGLDFSALIAAQAVCTAWRDGVKYHSFLWKVVCGRIGVRADSRAAFVRRLRACGFDPSVCPREILYLQDGWCRKRATCSTTRATWVFSAGGYLRWH